MYFELILKYKRSSKWIIVFMNVAMDAKFVKLNSSLVKQLPIVDPSLGHQLNSNDVMIYVMKTLNWTLNSIFCNIKSTFHAAGQIIGAVKFNSNISCVFKFPKMSISNKTFDLWLHKATFWSHVWISCSSIFWSKKL